MMNVPSIFVMGVPKAGTSKVADVLSESKSFSIGNIKEPKYFSNIYNVYDLTEVNNKKYYLDKPATLEDYIQCYDTEDSKILVDCSTDYFRFCHLVVPEIQKICTDPVFIVILRNPVDRCYSQYLNAVIQGVENIGLHQAIKKENERISSGAEPFFHYFNLGVYSDSLLWFKNNNIPLKVYIYEEIFESNVSFELFFFDAFGEKIKVDLSKKVNDSGDPIPYFFDFCRMIWGMIPGKYKDNKIFVLLKKYFRYLLLRKKIELSLKDRKLLYSLFKEDINKTFKILEREIPSWKLF